MTSTNSPFFSCPPWCEREHDPAEPGEHESRAVSLGSALAPDGSDSEPYVMIAHTPIDSSRVFIYVGNGFDAHIDIAAEDFQAMLSTFTQVVEPGLKSSARN